MSSIDDFHKMVGIVFSMLCESYPLPRDLDIGLVPAGRFALDGPAPEADGSGTDAGADHARRVEAFQEMFRNALRWLRTERFLTYDREQAGGFLGTRLTEKGAQALSRVPEGLSVPAGAAPIAAAKGSDAELVQTVKLAYGSHRHEVLGKVVLGVMFDQWSCNHYPEGGAPLLVHLGCDSGCRC